MPASPDRPSNLLGYLLLLPIVGGAVLAVVLAYGAIGGGSYTHAGNATNAALFSGTAVTKAETDAANRVVSCGRSTGTVAGIAYSTGPFIVHGVTESPKFAANPSASAKALSACLIQKFAPQGAAAQLCTIQAQHAPGLDQFTVGPYTESVVVCVSESGSS